VDLVLLDLHMPQMSGDTFFLALSRRWPRLADRIVLMTGDTFAETAHWPEELRACPLLLKPFTLETLRVTVVATLERGTSGEQHAGSGSA
jgi:CheY-like chemotaxis protein